VASPPSAILKAAARRQLRASLPDATRAALESALIRPPLLAWLLGSPSRTVAAFAPLPGEVDLLPLLAAAPGIRWVMPRVEHTALVFHATPDPEALVTGAFGISEPLSHLPVVHPEEIDVFLCPGLGFTPGGVRLGRGKGFYDRALAAARTFASQILPELPTEPHDLLMQYLATAEGVQPCR
jgi:5-formyltetrahydrofolate cyclo-ligase